MRTPVRQIAEEFEISVDPVRRWGNLAKLDKCPRKRSRFISPYARGLTLRDIRAHLQQRCRVSVSPDRISRVADAVNGEVKQWRQLPLDPLCTLLSFDALRVRIRDEGSVRNKAVRLALGIRMDPARQVLGLWIEQSEGARFWLQVMNGLKGRGMQGCLIAVVDGLKGFPQAMRGAFREAGVRTCIVHLMRHGLSLCSCRERRAMARRMQAIYRAASAEAAADRLDEFEQRWVARNPSVVAGWRRNWEEVIPMFAFAPEIRRLMDTANAIASLHRGLRKSLKTRGHFPNGKAAAKLLYQAIRNLETNWKAPVAGWRRALSQFRILFEDRLQGETWCPSHFSRLHRRSDAPAMGQAGRARQVPMKTQALQAHLLVCMLAYYLEWHMRRRLAPLLFAEEHPQEANGDPVGPARRKGRTHRTLDGQLPLKSLPDLLASLGTLTAVELRIEDVPGHAVPTLSELPPLQKKAFQLLGLRPHPAPRLSPPESA